MSYAARRENPPHIRNLELRNFRGFKSSGWIPLRPLTFLVGPNSSGKSSLVSPLMLVPQSRLGPPLHPTGEVTWSGPVLDLGSYEDAVHEHNTSLRIQFGIELSPGLIPTPWEQLSEDPSLMVMRVHVFLAAGGDGAGRVTRLRLSDVHTGESLTFSYGRRPTLELRGTRVRWEPTRKVWRFREWVAEQIDRVLTQMPPQRGHGAAWKRLREMAISSRWPVFFLETQRVTSGRSGPQRWYSVADERRRREPIIMEPRSFDTVDPSLLQQAGKDHELYPMSRRKSRPKETLSDVLERLNIASEVEAHSLSAYHSAIRVRDNVTNIVSSLTDVGYGASQVIPVIHACLSAAAGPLFVEQPEIHLHPKAQGSLAELLAATSLRRQVFVETHSVHLVNRARIEVAQGTLDHRDMIVLFVARTPKGPRITPIQLDENAEFTDPWPNGFFDERYQDTLQLLKLKSGDQT